MNRKFEAVPVEEWKKKKPSQAQKYNTYDERNGWVQQLNYNHNDKFDFLIQPTHVLVPVEDEWVSVEDRLPDRNELVLCAHAKDGWVVAGELTPEGEWYNQFQFKDTGDCSIIVTHWMPLPTPPKDTNS